MDQARLAGLGNLLTDELLWRARFDPARAAGSLSPTSCGGCTATSVGRCAELGERGGSHTGDLQEARARGGSCPRDGAAARPAHDRRPDHLLVPAPPGVTGPGGVEPGPWPAR